MQPVMLAGRRLPGPSLDESRAFARASLARLPDSLRGLDSCLPYPVRVSDKLRGLAEAMTAEGR